MMKTVRFAVMAGAAVICLSSCKNGKTAQNAVQEQIPVVAVQSAVVETVIDDKAYSSTVQPWAKNNIAPQSAGRIEELMVEVGDYVTAGQIVAKMDDVQLQQAELQLNNDKIEYDRLKGLLDKGGISQSDFDSFEMAYKVHKNQYNNLLKNTVLRSPITGVISARNYDKGDMYAMAMSLYTVEQVIPVKLLIAVSESDYSRIKKGDKASITVEAFPGETFTGTITNLYPTLDATTHTFNAEVKVANTNKRLRPGMYAKVTVTFGSNQSIIVPDLAVVKQQGSGNRYIYVYNEKDSTVKYQHVRLGRRLGDRYVIEGGIRVGDKVVTDGQLRLKDGLKVNLKKEEE